MNSPLREIRRVRHEIKQRRLLVDKVTAIPLEFDWYLFIGDETALPAIGRRLEELPAGSHAVVIAEVEDAAEEQSFTSKAKLRIHWVHRHGAPLSTTPSRIDSRAAAVP